MHTKSLNPCAFLARGRRRSSHPDPTPFQSSIYSPTHCLVRSLESCSCLMQSPSAGVGSGIKGRRGRHQESERKQKIGPIKCLGLLHHTIDSKLSRTGPNRKKCEIGPNRRFRRPGPYYVLRQSSQKGISGFYIYIFLIILKNIGRFQNFTVSTTIRRGPWRFQL
jgi:hypothetical protein